MVKVALKLEQKLKLSQMQRLTIQMMSLRGQDLQDFLHEQVTENPLLDIRYPDVRPSGSGQEKPIDNIRSHGESVEEALMKQLRVQMQPKAILMAAGLVIQSLDEKGFFKGELSEAGSEYGLGSEDMEQGLRLVQTFDPPGIGARTIQEALLIQTRRRSDAPAGAAILLQEHYEDFLHGRWQRVQTEMNLTAAELQHICRFLKKLSLQPAPQAAADCAYVRADVEIYRDDMGQLTVRSLEELPEVFFREDLYANYNKEGDIGTRRFIRRSKRQFLDLQTALAFRWQSIFTVMKYIILWQQGYFRDGRELRPLTQQAIADGTGLSTATVSRVCRDRYAMFDRHIYAVQTFLAHGYRRDAGSDGSISDKAIMKQMTAFIQHEDIEHPWSDQQITEHLRQRGIHIARRTVTKFRLKMNIPNSSMRKRMKSW